MDIDRGLFLSLSAAIAASSCKTSSPAPYRPRPGIQVGQPAPPAYPPGTLAPAPYPQGQIARAPFGPPPPAMEGTPPPQHEGGMMPPHHEGGMMPPHHEGGPLPAPHHEGGPAAAGADPAWRDECRRMTPPGPACESLQGGLGMCVGAVENARPGHRDALKSCIRRLGPQGLCDARIANQCVTPYFGSIGARRTVSQVCQQRASVCGGQYSAQTCEGLHAVVQPSFNVFPCDEGCGVWCLYSSALDQPAPRRRSNPFGGGF